MENCIIITHFKNPHQFWFRRAHSRIACNEEKLLIEEINKYCTARYTIEENGPNGCYEPAVGEIVAAYDPAANNWSRCRVLDAIVNTDGSIRRGHRLWALDDGMPKEAVAHHVKPLPPKFATEQANNVQLGAMRNILPAQHFYDPSEERICKKPSVEWEKSLIAALQSLVESAERTYFENITFHSIAGEEVQFGDLWFVTKQQKNVEATSIVLSVGPALIVTEDQFIQHMTMNSPLVTQNIPVVVKKEADTYETPRATCDLSKQIEEPVTDGILASPSPGGLTELTGIKSRTILAKLKRISQQKCGPTMPKSGNYTDHESSVASIDSDNAALDPRERCAVASKPCRSPAIDMQACDSSVTLERLTGGPVQSPVGCVKAPEPEHRTSVAQIDENDAMLHPQACWALVNKPCRSPTIDLQALNSSVTLERLTGCPAHSPVGSLVADSPVGSLETPDLKKSHQLQKLPNSLNKKLARLNRMKSEPTPAAAEKPPLITHSNEKTICVVQDDGDGYPEGTNAVPQSTSGESSTKTAMENIASPVTTQHTGDKDMPFSTTATSMGMATQRTASGERNLSTIDGSNERSEAFLDGIPKEINAEQLSTPQGKRVVSRDSEQIPSPVTIQSTGDIRKFELLLLKEQQCVLSQLRHHRILVHGLTAPKPIDSITKANFCTDVHHALEQLGIRKVYRLQAYAWPHIMRGNSLVCVNSAGTGKTFAFLPAVCSLVRMRIEEGLVSADAGPVGIILCYSTREVQRIAHLCRRMLNSVANKWLSVVECYGVRLVNQVCNTLFAGCALLVTTVPAYRRVVEAMPEAFVRKRIQIVAFDNIERMLQYFGSDILMLCKNCDKPDLQMVVTADYWHRSLGSFLMRYKNMIMCIGAYLEAAVYAKVQFLLRLRRDDGSKQHELAQYIREHDYRNQRTIVFGSTARDLEPIVETLRQYSIHYLVCSDTTIINQHDGFRNWDDRLPGDMVVLVVLDELLGDLCVSKAQHIVHYTLPTSWTWFTRRFATSFNYYDSPYVKGKPADKPTERPSTLVLLDENNNHQLPKLIDFLELHNVQFPEKLSRLAQNIRSVSEYVRVIDGKSVSALCPQLLALSACRNFRSCVYRHTLTVNDLAENTLPSSGTVRLNIFHVFSPVHFAGRIEALRGAEATVSSDGWKTLCDTKKFLLHDIRLQAHFANADRHQMYGKTVVRNDLCAIFHEQNYWRCRIIHFEPEGDSTTVGDVQLKLIDTGRILHTRSTNLLCLPEQFQALPGQAIDVRLAGVVPHDFEEDWDKQSTQSVTRWIEEHVQRPHHYVHAKVLLALRDTIWIDDLTLVEQLDTLRTAVVSSKIKSSIVSKQFGVHDTSSFERIQQLVRECQASRATARRSDDSLRQSNSEAAGDELKKNPLLETSSSSASLDDAQSSSESGPKIESSSPSSGSSPSENKRPDDNVVHAKRCLDMSSDLAAYPSSNEPSSNWKPLSTSPTKHEKPLPEDGGLSNGKNNSLSSTSSFEILSPVRDAEAPIVAASTTPVYSFDTLEKGAQYIVTIGRYFAPDLLYVGRVEYMQQIADKITTFVNANEGEMVPLANVQVGVYCFMYFEARYCRCQIVEVTERQPTVFMLDFGGTFTCDLDELFEIPPELLRHLPFAAIEATLAFIKPLQGTQWTEEIGYAVFDDGLMKYNDQGMIAYIVAQLEPRVEPPGSAADPPIAGCHRYELLLSDCDSSDPYAIVRELALGKLVQIDSKLFDQEGDVGWGELGGQLGAKGDRSYVADEQDEDDSSFVQVDFTHDEVKAVLAKFSRDQSVAVTKAVAAIDQTQAKKETSRATAANRQCDQKRRNSTCSVASATNRSVRKLDRTTKRAIEAPPFRLDCDYRFPATVWRQDDYFIALYVSAPEVSRYQLTVRPRSLLLQFLRDDHRYLLPLNLFGTIDPRQTTHEIRGLTIVIRLARLPGSTWHWPTLLDHTGKVPWLRQAIGRHRNRHTRLPVEEESDECVSSDDEDYDQWKNMLPTKLDYMSDCMSDNSQGEQDDDLGLHHEEVTEDDIFYRPK